MGSQCLELSAPVNHSGLRLSHWVCATWYIMQDLCISFLLPSVSGKHVPPCSTHACLFLRLEVSSSFIWICSLMLTSGFCHLFFLYPSHFPLPVILSVRDNIVFSHCLSLGSFCLLGTVLQTPTFFLLIMSNGNWLAMVSVSRAWRSLDFWLICIRVSSELFEFYNSLSLTQSLNFVLNISSLHLYLNC